MQNAEWGEGGITTETLRHRDTEARRMRRGGLPTKGHEGVSIFLRVGPSTPAGYRLRSGF
jgi:hypothetical protein